MAKSKHIERDPNVTLALLVVVVLIIFFTAITIPISNSKDVYIDFKVQKELTGSPTFNEVSARVQSSTLLEIPEFMGALWGLQADDVSVVASSKNVPSINKAVAIGDVTTGFDVKKRLTLKSIPADETQIILKLYEGTTLRETKVIHI